MPEDWRKANVTPIYRKGRKDPGNYKLVSQLHLDPREGHGAAKPRHMKHFRIVGHMKAHEIIMNSQHGFTKWKVCLSSLINLISTMK